MADENDTAIAPPKRAISARSKARRRKVAPRKRASTQSGVEIIEAILEAAHHVLAEHGIDGLTTNRVARRAGVSIGSLYQYFPNREAIMVEVARRLELSSQESIATQLRARAAAPLRELAGGVIDALLGEALTALPTRAAVRATVPAEWTVDTSAVVDDQLRTLVAKLMVARSDVRDGDVEVMSFIIAHAVEHVVERAVLSAPHLLSSTPFRDELVQLVVSFLSAGASPPTGWTP